MAEHHDRVASLNLCVTIDQDALSVAYQSANGDTSRQTEVLHCVLGHA